MVNLCRIKGAGVMRRSSRTEVPSAVQVHALADAMPTLKDRTMTLLSAWCGLRLGETTELRRTGVPSMTRAPLWSPGCVAPWFMSKVNPSLVIPRARRGSGMSRSRHTSVGTWPTTWPQSPPTLRWHDLRHFAGTTAAPSGATLAELQARLGHSTVAAALRSQHAANGRDEAIAQAMSNVVKMKPRTAQVDSDEPRTTPRADARP
jgi:hypothetical protein